MLLTRRVAKFNCLIQNRWCFSSLLIDKNQNGHIVTIALNDVGTRNSLSVSMIGTLRGVLAEVAVSNARVVIIRSNIPRVFSSGHNLKDIASKGNLDALFADCSALMCAIKALPQAVIAEVDGIATAAGCQLIATCDMAIASTSSKFATPGVNIGLFCHTPAVALARNVSHKHAMEMLLTGDFIDANHAHRIGLVNRIVVPDELEKEVAILSSRIASKSASAIALGKKVFQQQLTLDTKDAYDIASAAMVQNMNLADAEVGIRAFLDKKSVVF
jgi:enoyl-CoA hydratase/carnithine racemase